jgi:hypothetical protein
VKIVEHYDQLIFPVSQNLTCLIVLVTACLFVLDNMECFMVYITSSLLCEYRF